MSKPSNVRLAFLTALAVSLLPVLIAFGGPPEEEGIRRATPRFGSWSAGESPDGREYFVLFDDKGDVAKVIPLDNEVARYGKGDYFALVSNDRRGGRQNVRVFDFHGDLVSRFSVPSDRHVGLSGEIVMLLPQNLHGIGTAFDMEFLRLDGSFLRALRYEGVSLQAGTEYPNGHWLFGSLDRRGETPSFTVHHLDSQGRTVWKFDLGEAMGSVYVLAPSARFAVVSSISAPPDPPGEESRYSFDLLDESGSVIVSGHLPALQQGLFSPDDRHVVLVGARTIRLLRTIDGAEIWSGRRTARLARGSAIAFSPDGSRFYVVEQDTPTLVTPGPTRLTVYSIQEDGVTQSHQILNQIPTNRSIVVAGLEVARDGAVELITQRSGTYRVSP